MTERDSESEISADKPQATRVFKKSSQNGEVTVYLGSRDYTDHISHVDAIDGVVLLDSDCVKSKKVFAQLLATFKYGRDDLDVLGVTFTKDLYLEIKQIYPVDPNDTTKLTILQQRLVRKLGANAYPFRFDLPPNCPNSVTLQPAPGDTTGKPCGVEYELKIFPGDTIKDENKHKRHSVKLAIRKVMYAPSKGGPQPIIESSRGFFLSPGKLLLEASLDKELYHHGEEIAVNVHVNNTSRKTVKKIRVSVSQFSYITLYSTAKYRCTVAEVETEEGFTIGPGSVANKIFTIKPLLTDNKKKWGLALDGQLKHEDTNLASSTIIAEPATRESLGIVVSYKVKVKLVLGWLWTDLCAELPFILMHPAPELDELTTPQSPTAPNQNVAGRVDRDLIQLDDDADNVDIVFEDFARDRLKCISSQELELDED